MSQSVIWPKGKKFAFTIFDDTDNARLEDIKAVYDFLLSKGIFTTKSVWMLKPEGTPRIAGETCENLDYLNYIKYLNGKGFEIAMHNASSTSSNSQRTSIAFEEFKNAFGYYPRTFANHADNTENLYWGKERISGMARYLYDKLARPKTYEGHKEGSPYFWGNLSKSHIKYVRNLVFKDINTGKADPHTPYHDKTKPFVNKWFSSSNGSNLQTFIQQVTKERLNRLEKEGGYCIIYTHFCSFAKNGKLSPQFMEIIDYLSTKNGWFVPVVNVLDYLENYKKDLSINRSDLRKLEWKWLYEQLYGQFTKRHV